MDQHFVVSARKYRPSTFSTVVGQEHITTTLKNAIRNNHLAQAFLFCGPRGVGKTTNARILAKTINCENLTEDIEPCNECDSCRSFNTSSSFNIHELDAASNNSVDDIRSLVEQVRFPPQSGKYKIYIIDEVHMLSTAAFNAFLKTLEEPPSYAIFILATTEKHKIIPTILSRCQIFDFNRIQVNDIAVHLRMIADKEEVNAEDEALHLIAQKADGALRDALSLFDLMVTFAQGDLTYKQVVDNLHILDYDYYFQITEQLLDENLSEVLLIFDEILKKGFDGHNFITGLAEHFRNLMVSKDEATVQLMEVSDSTKERYLEQAEKSTLSFLLTALNLASQCDQGYKASRNQRLHVELALMKIAHLNSAVNLAKEGGLKKKDDTPVEPTGQAQATPSYQNSAPAIPKINQIGTLKTPISTPQIKAVEEPEPTPITKEEDFTEDALYSAWREYISLLKRHNKTGEMVVLDGRNLKKAGNSISFSVDNAIQLGRFSKLKEHLTNFLRNKLNNGKITLEASVSNSTENSTTNLVESEEFKQLAKKYPKLHQLKDELGLDNNF